MTLASPMEPVPVRVSRYGPKFTVPESHVQFVPMRPIIDERITQDPIVSTRTGHVKRRRYEASRRSLSIGHRNVVWFRLHVEIEMYCYFFIEG